MTLVDARDTTEIDVPAGISMISGRVPLEALGRRDVTGVRLARAGRSGWEIKERIGCDLLLVSGGWSPVINLASHRGVTPEWDAEPN